MPNIRTFLKSHHAPIPAHGSAGLFSEWLAFEQLDLQGQALQFVEKRVIGLRGAHEYECVEIPVMPGRFIVECRGVLYGTDARVAAMRAYPEGATVSRGGVLKELPVDLGGIAVVDIDHVHASMNEDSDLRDEWLDDVLYCASLTEQVFVDLWEPTNTRIPSCESGFGDGGYPCYALLQGGKPVGLEVEFIPEGTTYAFGKPTE